VVGHGGRCRQHFANKPGADMNLFATLRFWWKAMVNRSRMGREVEEEFKFHIDAYVADLIRQGIAPADAQRKARIDLGRADTQNEKFREAIGLRAFDELGADIRYGLRSLCKNPGYSTVAILSLALGIGATTAMFTLIYAVLIHPFPYADSDRIMNPDIITEEGPRMVGFAMDKSQFEVLKKAQSIENLLGFFKVNAELTGEDLPEDAAVMYLTENADTFFGVRALLGRGIQPSDAEGGGQHVAVLNYKFWQRHFHGDRAVIGRTLQLNHIIYTIVGIMPRTFAFNDTFGVSDVYLPKSLQRDSTIPRIRSLYVPSIKLKANVSPAAADAELDAIVHQFAKENPNDFTKRFHLHLQPIIVPYEQNTGHTLALLLAGVLLLLAIGCANCSILLLARGEARQHELAVRSAIGASRWRIIRQLLVEALVVSFSGAALGVVSSYWLAKLPLQLSPNSFPPESVIRINLPILMFSAGLALLCGILFGLFPALRLSRPDLARTVQATLRRIGGNDRGRKVNPLIAGQIALTLLLLATAGMAIGAFLHLTNLPLGYDPDHVMQAGIVMHWSNPKDWHDIQSREGRVTFVDQIRQKMAAIPGVTSVAVGSDSTPPYSGIDYPVEVAGKSNTGQDVRVHLTSPEFFATLHIRLLRGRVWTQAENQQGDFVAVVNEAFAHCYWSQGDPTGQRLRLPTLKASGPVLAASPDSAGWRQVVGVIADLRNDGVDRPAVPAIYLPYTTFMVPRVQFEIRTQGEPLAMLHSVRAAVQSVASDQQVSDKSFDLKEAIERDSQWTRQRLFSVLFGFFSALALLLALVGLFSVVSYSVAQRTAELGIRMALGASRRRIAWIAVRMAAQSVIVGIAGGLTVQMLIQRLLTTWMGNSDPAPRNVVPATMLLILCSVIACLLPARRAASIHPVEALRYE
jgi:predicted permease